MPQLMATELRHIEQLRGFDNLIRAALAIDDVAAWQLLIQKRSEAVVAYRRSLEGRSLWSKGDSASVR